MQSILSDLQRTPILLNFQFHKIGTEKNMATFFLQNYYYPAIDFPGDFCFV